MPRLKFGVRAARPRQEPSLSFLFLSSSEGHGLPYEADPTSPQPMTAGQCQSRGRALALPPPVPRGPVEARRPRVPARAPRGDPHAHVWLASLLLQPTSPATRECAWADPRRGLGGAEREPGSAAVPGARHAACERGSRHTDSAVRVKIEA